MGRCAMTPPMTSATPIQNAAGWPKVPPPRRASRWRACSRMAATLPIRLMNALWELARRTGELAEQQHAGLVVARGDELLCDEVHPVVQAAHEAEVGRAVVLVDLVGVVVRDDEHDGRRTPVRESCVDALDERA